MEKLYWLLAAIIVLLILIIITLVVKTARSLDSFLGDLKLMAESDQPQCLQDLTPSVCGPFSVPITSADITTFNSSLLVGKFIAYVGSVMAGKPDKSLINVSAGKLVTWSGDPNLPFGITYGNTIIFRGTLTKLDFVKDLLYSETTQLDKDVEVHDGFYEIYSELKSDLMGNLTKGTPVYIAAHSLGCAVALLFAYDLLKAGYTVTVANYAPPRTGNQAFVDALSGANITSYINMSDIVPTLPPSYIAYDQELYQYAHAGNVVVKNLLAPDVMSCHNMVTYYTLF